jgi:hypothetical protein
LSLRPPTAPKLVCIACGFSWVRSIHLLIKSLPDCMVQRPTT